MLEDIVECHMVTSVEIPYDSRFYQGVLEWASGVIALAGASPQEIDGIQLALEETLSFIVSAYSDAASWEVLRVDIRLMTDGVAEVALSNAGPPVHLDRIPKYNPDNPESPDQEGLWLFLARKMVDSLEFNNLGMKGWLVVIKQQLSNPSYKTDNSTKENESNGPRKKHNFTSRLATSDDAGALVDLTYDTYRYSYPGDEFYHQSKLTERIKEGEMECIIVEEDGVIIANTTMTITPKTPQCCYTGTLMVRRAFRRTRAIIVMMKEVDRYVINNRRGADVYYATSVTQHAASQKASEKAGGCPLAFLLGVGAAVDYRGMNVDESARETFLIFARFTKPSELKTLFLPERHRHVVRPLLDQLVCPAEFDWDSSKSPKGESLFSYSEDHTEGNANITFEYVGEEWASQLRKCIFQLTAKQIRSIVILIPAWQQPPSDLDQQMAQQNSIFTGIKPISVSKYYLVYCVITCTVDFEQIKIASPLADSLKNHIQMLYQETFA